MSPEAAKLFVYIGLLAWAGFWMFVAGYYMDKADRLRREMFRYRRMAGRR